MLKHYNLNKQYVENIYNYTDDSVVSELSTGDKTLTFTVRGKSDIQCEEYIQTEDQRYVVKEIQPGNDDTVEYTCQLDLEPLEGSVFEVFTAADKTVTQAANLALAGTGWRVSTSLTKKRNVQCMKKTPLEVLYLIRDAFMCEIRFDSINKIVYYAEQFGSDRGVYFRKDLNLKDVSVRTDSYDYCTRIIPIGKDDLRIDNNGKEYVENYQYSSKIRAIIWEDSSYEDADALQEDAEGKLEDLSKPKKSYSADIRDLAKLSADYDILSFGLGDTVWIVDEGKSVKEKQRIVKITEYPHDPGKNKCELSNTVLSWEEMQKKLEAAANAWEDVSNKDGSINGVHVYGISDGNKVIIQAEVTNNETVQANAAGVAANTAAIGGVVQDLTAVTARVGTIETSYLTATQIQANYAAINFANIDTANIDTAKVMNLFTQVGLIRDAVISQAKITGYLDAVKINAASIDAGTLSVDRLVIRGDNTSLVYAINNITGALQAQNVNTINGEVLTDRTILADKIVAGSITSNEIAAGAITADKISVTELSAIAASLGNITGGSIDIGSGNFTVTTAGAMTSQTGEIGGWTINNNQLYKTVVSGGYEYRAILNAPLSLSGSTTAIATAIRTNDGNGNVGSWSYPFAVQFDGTLAAIKGSVGGWTIGRSSIYSGTKGSTSGLVTLTSGTNASVTIESDILKSVLGYSGIKVTSANTETWYAQIDDSGIEVRGNYLGGTEVFYAEMTGDYVKIGNASSTITLSSGNGVFTGQVSAKTFKENNVLLSNKYAPISGSDIRLKKNIGKCEVNDALSVINQIECHSFDWRCDGEHQTIGFIADELEEIDEQFAIGGGYDANGEMRIKSVNTFYLQGYEIKAIQELHAEIKALKGRIQELQSKIA